MVANLHMAHTHVTVNQVSHWLIIQLVSLILNVQPNSRPAVGIQQPRFATWTQLEIPVAPVLAVMNLSTETVLTSTNALLELIVVIRRLQRAQINPVVTHVYAGLATARDLTVLPVLMSTNVQQAMEGATQPLRLVKIPQDHFDVFVNLVTVLKPRQMEPFRVLISTNVQATLTIVPNSLPVPTHKAVSPAHALLVILEMAGLALTSMNVQVHHAQPKQLVRTNLKLRL